MNLYQLHNHRFGFLAENIKELSELFTKLKLNSSPGFTGFENLALKVLTKL